MSRALHCLFALTLSAGVAGAQSFNIDFGEVANGVPSTYAGAGQAGFWNSLPLAHTSAAPGPCACDVMLVDVNGVQTSVGIHNFGGTAVVTENDPSVTGDDAVLMNDGLITHNVNVQTCLYLNGLENGTYEVISYAWTPNHPEVENEVKIDNAPGVFILTGPWSGQHEEGVTYALHTVEVTNGFMGPHAGLPFGEGDPVVGSVMNGIQLRKIDAVSVPDVGEATRRLHRPAPSPFRSATTFTIVLAAPERIGVGVYDAQGRFVTSLVDGLMAGGVQQVKWDGTNAAGRSVSAGVYFVRLTSSTGAETQKVVLDR